MRPLKYIFLLLAFALSACDHPRATFLWKSYEHPTFGFSLKHPRSWKVGEGGTFGTTLTLLPPEDDTLFRTNMNMVVELADNQPSLNELIQKSQTQLASLLQNYKVLAVAPTKVGAHAAMEIRASYRSTEGDRIIRTWIAKTPHHVIIFTFTSRVDNEARFQKTVRAILNSFKT